MIEIMSEILIALATIAPLYGVAGIVILVGLSIAAE
jgi:hypothetical protein